MVALLMSRAERQDDAGQQGTTAAEEAARFAGTLRRDDKRAAAARITRTPQSLRLEVSVFQRMTAAE
jgi:hypothetical protein